MNLPKAKLKKEQEEIELYRFLLKNLTGNRCRVNISQEQHITLLKIKNRQQPPFDNYEYGLAIGNLFVNANWLVRYPMVTEIWNLTYYQQTANGNHRIND